MVQMMQNKPYLTLRVKFKKVGSLQYISHLDLVRTMNKIIVRAGLPLWYSEGFNPKPKMIFAAPLSIGTESLCEYMDVRLVERVEPEEAKAKLNANMTDEMQVIEAYYPDTKLTDMKWLSYDIDITTDGADEKMAERCSEALLGERVIIQKKTKPGEPAVTADIRPLIKSCKSEYKDGVIRLSLVLSADASAFLNPEYTLKALRSSVGILSNPDLTKEYYSVLRTHAYCGDMSEFV